MALSVMTAQKTGAAAGPSRAPLVEGGAAANPAAHTAARKTRSKARRTSPCGASARPLAIYYDDVDIAVVAATA